MLTLLKMRLLVGEAIVLKRICGGSNCDFGYPFFGDSIRVVRLKKKCINLGKNRYTIVVFDSPLGLLGSTLEPGLIDSYLQN